MGESFQWRGSREEEGEGLLGMWLGIELVGKESVCNVALSGLKITDSRSPVMMTGQIIFWPDKPGFWQVK